MIKDEKIQVLCDSGATKSYISKELCNKQKISCIEKNYVKNKKFYVLRKTIKKGIFMSDRTRATVSKKASINFAVEENKNTKYKLKTNVLEGCVYRLIFKTNI